MTPKIVYTINETAALLNVSPSLLYNQTSDGNIKCIRIGKKILIPRTAIEDILGQPLADDQ
jgi:excisionase family DNA binding protein